MPHHYQSGGCIDAAFTRDGQYVLTAGDCGTLTCWIMQYASNIILIESPYYTVNHSYWNSQQYTLIITARNM